MDWKLTKSLFIASFLLMNIILVYILYNESNEEVRELAETTNVLSKTNIDTSALDGFESTSMHIILGEPSYINDENNESEIDETEPLTVPLEQDVEFDRENLTAYKDDSIYRGEEYHYDEIMSGTESIIYNQYYEDYPIFSHEAARLYFSANSMSMTQRYVENINKSDYSVDQTVRHPKKIIEDLYLQESITGNAIVESATLGYYIILEEEDRVMMRPKWQFEIMDEDVSRIIYADALSQTEDIIERE